MTFRPKGLPSPTSWLWWAAVLTLLTGAIIAYLVSLFTPDTDPERLSSITLVLAITIAVSGLFVIGATAGWWVRR